MKKLFAVFAAVVGFTLATSAYADAICNDGTYSYGSGSGTCSHHGGVRQWLPNT